MVLALQACAGSQQLIGLTHHAPQLLDSLIHHRFAALSRMLLTLSVPLCYILVLVFIFNQSVEGCSNGLIDIIHARKEYMVIIL